MEEKRDGKATARKRRYVVRFSVECCVEQAFVAASFDEAFRMAKEQGFSDEAWNDAEPADAEIVDATDTTTGDIQGY